VGNIEEKHFGGTMKKKNLALIILLADK